MLRLTQMPNARSIGVIKEIEKHYPSFAKKILEGNKVMQMFVLSGYNTTDILNFPVCGKCETLAAWDRQPVMKNGRYVPVCTCFKCGKTTVDPILFREWAREELKKKAPEEINDVLETIVDVIADRLVTQAENTLIRTINKERGINRV